MILHKNFKKKPSLLKPVTAAVVILLAIGGAYAFFGNKDSKQSNKSAKEDGAKIAINGSGLDKNQKVKNVSDVEEVIAKWVESNPQAILQSVANMQKKVTEERLKDAQKNIATKKDEIFDDASSPRYEQKNYDITIVEFFDYSCGYCKKAQHTVEELLKEDKKLRVIYKEFPILGQPSHEMAQVALAVNIIDPSSYKKFHDALMKSSEKGKEGAIKVAKSIGLNHEKIEATLKRDKEKIEAIIQANLNLGGTIGINGTPGFIIGEELIPGALDVATFKEKIAAARAKK